MSGDVLRKLLVQLEDPVDLTAPLRFPPSEPSLAVKVRQRASRRAVKGACEVAEAEARAQRVARKLMDWSNDTVGKMLLDDASVGTGRRIPLVETTPVAVPLETGPSECSGGVQHEDGPRARGDKRATLRTVVDHAGLLPQGGLAPMQGHALPLWRLVVETASVLRAGDVGRADRGLVEGATRTLLQQQRRVDVIVPLQSTRWSSVEAGPRAALQGAWQAHPARDHQPSAFVQGVEHLWEAWKVPLHAGVMRSWNRQKDALDSSVLVPTDQRLTGPWIVRHDAERPEIHRTMRTCKVAGGSSTSCVQRATVRSCFLS